MNSKLREVREHPNVLLPGDVVYIPKLQSKEVQKPTNEVHRFTLKGVPAKLKIQILEYGEPVMNQPFTCTIDGQIQNGKTDSEGFLSIAVSPATDFGKLEVGEGSEITTYLLNIGQVSPIDSIKGAANRLRNLGYAVEKKTAEMSPELEQAIRDFQSKQSIEVAGELNSETKAALLQAHGC